MARVQNTLIGKSSGSVGGATFSTWKGINVLKSKAIVVANPQTPAQMLQRAKMSIMVATFRLIAGIVNVGFKSMAIGKSAYNAFVAENIGIATTGSTAETVVLDADNIILAKGTMGSISIETVTGTNASASVPITWDDALEPVGSSPSDLAYAAVYNITKDMWGFATPVARSTGTITVSMPEPVVTADALIGFLFFKSASSDVVSDSQVLSDTV